MEFKQTKKPEPKKVRGFSIDDDIYNDFRDECLKLNMNMSATISEFLRRVNLLLKSGDGGEIVFGVEGRNWKQPEKIVYDGVQIIDRGGVRKLKDSGGKKT